MPGIQWSFSSNKICVSYHWPDLLPRFSSHTSPWLYRLSDSVGFRSTLSLWQRVYTHLRFRPGLTDVHLPQRFLLHVVSELLTFSAAPHGLLSDLSLLWQIQSITVRISSRFDSADAYRFDCFILSASRRNIFLVQLTSPSPTVLDGLVTQQ